LHLTKSEVSLRYRENFVFVPSKFEAPIGANNSVFGGSFTVGEKTSISSCFFGANISIGSGSSISQAITGKDVTIGKDVRIEKAIICDNILIEDGTVISNCIVLNQKTKIPLVNGSKRDKQKQGHSRSSSLDTERSIWPDQDEHIKPSARYRKPQKPNRRKNSDSTSTTHIPPVKVDPTYEIAREALKGFDEEVHESMKNALDSEDWSDIERLQSLILEINGSKLAYNISMDDVSKHIFFAYLNQPKFGPTLNDMKKVTEGWRHVWTNYYRPAKSKLQILNAIEDYVIINMEWVKYAPNYVLFLYNDLDILTDEIIIEWYKELSNEHPLKNDGFNQLVDWLMESEDEEESSEGDY